MLDIGGGETCTFGSAESDGTYPLVVRQPPDQVALDVKFSGDTTRFTSGAKRITLTRG